MRQPHLLPVDPKRDPKTDGIMFAVYAPFGDDKELSTYPEGTTGSLAEHPLLGNLLKVAEQGVHVAALIDLAGDCSYLVDIPAGRPAAMTVTSRFKLDMAAPCTLAGLLRHAAAKAPGAALVLALEGHGAGFYPDIDASQLTSRNVTANGQYQWRVDAGTTNIYRTNDGKQAVENGAPILPAKSPGLPANGRILSTWGIGHALAKAEEAGAPKVSVICFSNCFNLSVELMHTVAAHAHVATAYANYDFFTAGDTYPGVFADMRAAGSATPHQLALAFAHHNRDMLKAKGHHPTMGGVVDLAIMRAVAERVDDLSDALLAALRNPVPPLTRAQVVDKIAKAIRRAQQFDSDDDPTLEVPDQLTDLRSLAAELARTDFPQQKVQPAAQALEKILAGVFVYGEKDTPWIAPSIEWDFLAKPLAMNIFLPDPVLQGKWDWRSPYYLDVNPDPTQPRVQPNIIEFVKVTDWVDFLIEYHKGVPFKGLLPARIPTFPVFNAGYEPPGKHDGCDGDGDDDGDGDGPGKPDGNPGRAGEPPQGATSN